MSKEHKATFLKKNIPFGHWKLAVPVLLVFRLQLEHRHCKRPVTLILGSYMDYVAMTSIIMQ